jgi:hypothetical protein
MELDEQLGSLNHLKVMSIRRVIDLRSWLRSKEIISYADLPSSFSKDTHLKVVPS